MNRRLFQFQYSSVPMLTLVDCIITVGAAGAVSASSGNLVASVTHVSTGIYKINLKDNLNAYIGHSVGVVKPAASASGLAVVEAKDTSPADLTSKTVPTFTINCYSDAAGTLTDPASGSKISVLIQGRNSSVTA